MKPDNTSRKNSTTPSMEGRKMENSKERKTTRSGERREILPPMQTDTVSVKNGRNRNRAGRRPKSSKDEWKANRSGERGVILIVPPLQAETISAKKIRRK